MPEHRHWIHICCAASWDIACEQGGAPGDNMSTTILGGQIRRLLTRAKVLVSVTEDKNRSKPSDIIRSRRQLKKETDNWGGLSSAISRVIKLKEA